MLDEKFEAADVKSVIGPKKSGVPEEGGGSMSGF